MRKGLFILVAAVGLSVALAQDKDEEEQGLPPEEKMIRLVLKEGNTVADALKQIREQTGIAALDATRELLNKKLPPITTGWVRWRTALEWVARQVDAEIRKVDVNWLQLYYVPRVTLKLRDSDLRDVLRYLAAESGKNIVIAPEVTGKVTVTLNRVPWSVALDAIVRTLGYVAVKEDYDIIRIVKPESLREQLITRVIQLKYLRPPDPYEAQFPMGGGTAGGGAGATTPTGTTTTGGEGGAGGVGVEIVKSRETGERAFALIKTLRNALTPNVGKLEYDAQRNVIIVTDTKPKVDEIVSIIKQLDKPLRQVRIDVKFIWTTTDDIFQRGLQWSAAGNVLEGPAITASFPKGSENREGTYRFDFGRWNAFKSGFYIWGVIDFSQAQVLLRYFRADQNSEVVQKPTLITVDSEPAVIFVGERIPFAEQEAQTDQLGNVVVTYKQAAGSPVSVGFTLYIIPHIISDTGEVDLTIIPSMSDLVRFEVFGSGPNEIRLPHTRNQTLKTRMLLKDGMTAVVGGLMKQEMLETNSGIPFLSDVPVLGYLFKWKEKSSVLKNLIIFITPHVVKSSEDHLSLAEEKLWQLREIDYFYQRYRSGIGKSLGEMLEKERLRLAEEKARKEAARKAREEGGEPVPPQPEE
ncbi:MAG: hypothetical protein DRP63_01420 [Planctomycetota bacterium]|nr:MAG: hypothetical protein DRP63_01420 [Planctomycetota bacterium]